MESDGERGSLVPLYYVGASLPRPGVESPFVSCDILALRKELVVHCDLKDQPPRVWAASSYSLARLFPQDDMFF